jgi:hypothetical protein
VRKHIGPVSDGQGQVDVLFDEENRWLGRWRFLAPDMFDFIIDEYQYAGLDVSLQVIPHCTVTFVSADRFTGTCTAALISPEGVQIALVPGNTIEGVRLRFPTDY